MTEMIEQQIKWEIWGRDKNILFKFYNKKVEVFLILSRLIICSYCSSKKD